MHGKLHETTQCLILFYIIPFAKDVILLLCIAMLSLGFSLQGFKLINDFHDRTELICVYRQFESFLSFFFVGEVGFQSPYILFIETCPLLTSISTSVLHE